MARSIAIEKLDVAYGGIQALSQVDLEVCAGEIVAVLGANGAGKTTLLNTISGLVRSRAGRILIDGEEVNGWRAERIARSGVRLVPEGRRIFTRLTVEENLRLGGYFLVPPVFRARFDELVGLFPLLGERRASYAGYLSGGEQQIVAVSRALISKPDILLLDEPSAGLSPIATATVYESLSRVAAQTSITMLVVEQNVRWALNIAQRGYVLDLGEVKLAGTRAELEGDSRVAALYLGENENAEVIES
jgi:branched-chain amino acid transport system ATP-binding protein